MGTGRGERSKQDEREYRCACEAVAVCVDVAFFEFRRRNDATQAGGTKDGEGVLSGLAHCRVATDPRKHACDVGDA